MTIWDHLARSGFARFFQDTPFAGAVTEGVHLIGIAFFFGAIVLLDLRLLGFGTRLVVPAMARLLLTITLVAFAVVTVSGLTLFVASATRWGNTPLFWVKIGLIVLGGLNALTFHGTAWRTVAVWGGAAQRPPAAAIAFAAVSTGIWLTVLILGRSLGYQQHFAQPPDEETLQMLEGIFAFP